MPPPGPSRRVLRGPAPQESVLMANQPDFMFDFDFSKYLGDLKVPGLDMEALVSSQRRNLEALTQVNKTALDGMQAVMKRQAEILRQLVEEASQAAQDIVKAETPQDKLSRQTELTKEAFEKTVSNLRELMEMMAKSNTEVADVLNSRVGQILDEARDLVAKQQLPFKDLVKKD
ncbi:Activator of polymer mobilization [Pararhodospirillum photometricum DSM 122]|uniref:Activator of polymer mobilization n=2 Tax=Pararhodospirillum photometricum TaxID=1084 RepID=H6SRA5_PARPM|nr:Activator of polymer mobilization [Pararhodospirillum photometricum DSM 122]